VQQDHDEMTSYSPSWLNAMTTQPDHHTNLVFSAWIAFLKTHDT